MKRREGTYRGVYTYGLKRISERDLAAVEGVPNDPLYYLYDGRGSVSQLVNTENHVCDKYRYTPFGVPMPGGQLTPNTRLFNNPYGYNGEDYDIESGLQFLRARYYNPETARFISRDSYLGDVTEPLSLNRYAYTSNNPVMNIDPSGHIPQDSSGDPILQNQIKKGYLEGLSNSSDASKRILELWAKGSDVAELQQRLKALDYDIGDSGVDGIYGPDTVKAVKAFQAKYKLQVDGKAGPQTLAELGKRYDEYLDEKRAESEDRSKYNVACGDKKDISGGTQGAGKPGPTLMEAAEIAEHVYGRKGSVLSKGWEMVRDPYVDGSLRMAVYGRIGANGKMEYVIANAGTEPTSLADWKNNLQQPFGKSKDMLNSIDYAKEFVERNPNAHITFVGHSKGGAEAAANAVETNRNAILFNPATVSLQAYGLDSSKYTAEMTAYIVKGDILNNIFDPVSKPIGNVEYLPRQHIVSPLLPDQMNTVNSIRNHLMGAVKDAIIEKGWEGKK